MGDVRAWRPNDPAFGELAEKVWMFSGSPMYVTKTIVGALRRWYSEGEETIFWRYSSRQTTIPYFIGLDEK